MTVTQMKYFIVVAKHCNMREASEVLFVSQQALSKQIQALEKDVGFLLFQRRNKKLYLTEAGEFLLKAWEPALRSIELNLKRAQRIAEKNQVVIGIPSIYGILNLLIPFVSDQMDHGCQVEYVVDSINNLIQKFEDKSIDLLIVFQADLDEIKTEYLSTTIKRMPYGVICRKDHLLFLKKEVMISDIESETICCFDQRYMKYMEQDIYRQFADFGKEPAQIRRYSDWTNMEVALLSGAGITMTYEAFLPVNSESLGFIPLKEKVDNPVHNLVMAWRQENLLPFVRNLKEAFL